MHRKTENLLYSAGGLAAAALILVGFSPLTDLLARWASPWLVEAVSKFSVLTHYDGFQKGVLDSRDLLYFLSLMAYALFATGVVIRNHRTG